MLLQQVAYFVKTYLRFVILGVNHAAKLLKIDLLCKKLLKNLVNSSKSTTFAPLFKTMEHWRDGRVVDYSSLENYRTERYRGFESLSLR